MPMTDSRTTAVNALDIVLGFFLPLILVATQHQTIFERFIAHLEKKQLDNYAAVKAEEQTFEEIYYKLEALLLYPKTKQKITAVMTYLRLLSAITILHDTPEVYLQRSLNIAETKRTQLEAGSVFLKFQYWASQADLVQIKIHDVIDQINQGEASRQMHFDSKNKTLPNCIAHLRRHLRRTPSGKLHNNIKTVIGEYNEYIVRDRAWRQSNQKWLSEYQDTLRQCKSRRNLIKQCVPPSQLLHDQLMNFAQAINVGYLRFESIEDGPHPYQKLYSFLYENLEIAEYIERSSSILEFMFLQLCLFLENRHTNPTELLKQQYLPSYFPLAYYIAYATERTPLAKLCITAILNENLVKSTTPDLKDHTSFSAKLVLLTRLHNEIPSLFPQIFTAIAREHQSVQEAIMPAPTPPPADYSDDEDTQTQSRGWAKKTHKARRIDRQRAGLYRHQQQQAQHGASAARRRDQHCCYGCVMM